MILEKFDDYLRDDDEEDPANYIIRKGIRDYYDFSLYSKELWDFFHSRYGGTPVRRKFEKVGMGMTRVEYRPKPLNLLVLPKISTLLQDPGKDLPPPYKFYMSIHRNIKDLFGRVHHLLTTKCDMDFEKDEFRLWKLSANIDIDYVNDLVKKGMATFKEKQSKAEIKE